MDVDTESGAGSDTNIEQAADVVVVRRGARVLLVLGRVVLSFASVVVLVLVGFNWITLRHLDQGIARTNVFDTPVAGPSAAGQAPPTLTSDANILIVGMDSRTDPHGNALPADELAMLHAGPDTGELNTDTMILVHIPAGGQQAVAVSFPRDAYVPLAGGFGTHRLNSAFAYARNAEVGLLRAQGVTDPAELATQGATAGRKNLIATIESLIGNAVTINRYAEINLVGFYQMSQAVGGVQVCLAAATQDDYTNASFPAGVQTISGVQALNFVRQRHGLPRGDLDRIVRQQVFLGALANRMLSAGTLANPSRIGQLTTAIQNSVTLSAGWDVASFAAQLQGLTSGAIQFDTIPTGDNIRNAEGDVTQIDQDAVRRFVAGLVGGTTPGTTDFGPTDTATTGTPPPATSQPGTTDSAGSTTGSAAGGSTAPGPITANGIRCVN